MTHNIRLDDVAHEIAKNDLPIEIQQMPGVPARLEITDDGLAEACETRHFYPTGGDEMMSVVQIIAEHYHSVGNQDEEIYVEVEE